MTMWDQFKKILKHLEKLKKDNEKELWYGTGMMGPGAQEHPPVGHLEQQQQTRGATNLPKKVTCKHCNLDGHQRISSKKCKKHPDYNAGGKMVRHLVLQRTLTLSLVLFVVAYFTAAYTSMKQFKIWCI